MHRLVLMASFLLLIACGTETQSQSDSGVNDVKALTQKDGEADPKKEMTISEADKQQAMSNYLVPSPGEILSALDKLDRVEWSQLASYNSTANYANKYSRSLNLGVRIADSFVAINAEDAENFGAMSGLVFDLGRELGISRVLTEKRDDLEELASRGSWPEMRAELDNIQGEIKAEVEALGEDDLMVLAGIGGWLEGLRVVSAHLKDNYSEDKSELLNQGQLIQYYADEIAKLGSDANTNPVVKAVADGLTQIQTVIPATEANKVELEHVRSLHQVSERLIQTIEKG